MYPGVRPKSKEAAVLMLADTVEAASRTLKRPTEARLEQFVQDMIMEKFTSGDLGDSTLTLRDLELIRKSFVHILEGYFHTRIEYPQLARPRRDANETPGGAEPPAAAQNPPVAAQNPPAAAQSVEIAADGVPRPAGVGAPLPVLRARPFRWRVFRLGRWRPALRG